VTLTLAVTILP
jgi:hypothetical protein